MSWKNDKNSREKIYIDLNNNREAWKNCFYYGLHHLIKRDAIFSKLPYLLGDRRKISPFDSQLSFLKNMFILPVLFLWRIFFIKIERKYYRIKYPEVCTFQEIPDEDFDYLFVLNTKDHIIAALPVLERMDSAARSLVVTFKGEYIKYRGDFNKLKNIKIIFFEYELKDLPLKKYLRISKESGDKFRLLESQNLNNSLRRLIQIDKNFITFHLKTELIQYSIFEKIFNEFNIKGAISIVFTTAFELCKERGIPTFILQHGIGGKWHGYPHVSDYWFTFDEISEEELDHWLDHTVKVLPAGSPRFEYLKDNLILKRDITGFNKKIGKPGYRKIVTYVGGAAENQLTFQALKNLRNILPEYVNIIIKLHPRVPLNMLNLKKEMEKILTKSNLEHMTFIRSEVDFYEILAHSDIMITGESTGMLEAIAVDIPTIQVNFTSHRYSHVYDLSSYGWKGPVNDSDTLTGEVMKLISDEEYYKDVIKKQRWLKERLLKNFGVSGKIIAETIVSICNKKSKI